MDSTAHGDETAAANTAATLVEAAAAAVGVTRVLAAVQSLLGWGSPSPSGPGFFTDGQFFSVRPLVAADAQAVDDFLRHGLSERARSLRFLTSDGSIPPHASQALANRDGRHRVALAAFVAAGQVETMVAMAEYAFPPDSAVPEVAIAVADRFTRRGVGTQLLRMLAVLSIAGGYLDWSALIATENAAVIALLRRVGQVQTVTSSAGTSEVRIRLDPDLVFTATSPG